MFGTALYHDHLGADCPKEYPPIQQKNTAVLEGFLYPENGQGAVLAILFFVFT